jgi:protein SCO1/2
VKRSALAATMTMVAFVLSACGGDDRSLVGGPLASVPPDVGTIALPDLADGGAEFALTAQPDALLLVYFGYTNCPDFCPTTLSNVKLARQQLEEPEQVEMAMITVDPDRDLPVLAEYVTGFMPDAHALGTDDPAALARAAEPFLVTYDVRQADGEVEVGHTTALYAVDDTGSVVVRWRPDVTIDDLAADLEQLLDEQ